MHRGRWLMHGELLGAQLFLPEGEITWAHSARTLTFSTLISLDKETFHRSACQVVCRCAQLESLHPVQTCAVMHTVDPFALAPARVSGPWGLLLT